MKRVADGIIQHIDIAEDMSKSRWFSFYVFNMQRGGRAGYETLKHLYSLKVR